MKISFNLNIDDLLAFYKQGLKKKSFIFKKHIFFVGAGIALLLSYFDRYIKNASDVDQLSNFSNNFWFMSAYNLFFVTICIFLVRMIFIAFLRIQMRKKIKFIGERYLEIVKDKIIFSSQSSKTEYPIKTILKIEENRHHYFIYVNEISAITLPKKTVGSKNMILEISEKTNIKVISC